MVHNEHSKVLKILFHTHHINKKVYRCFIENIPNNVSSRSFCECANGYRSVGFCSHYHMGNMYLKYRIQ